MGKREEKRQRERRKFAVVSLRASLSHLTFLSQLADTVHCLFASISRRPTRHRPGVCSLCRDEEPRPVRHQSERLL